MPVKVEQIKDDTSRILNATPEELEQDPKLKVEQKQMKDLHEKSRKFRDSQEKLFLWWAVIVASVVLSLASVVELTDAEILETETRLWVAMFILGIIGGVAGYMKSKGLKIRRDSYKPSILAAGKGLGYFVGEPDNGELMEIIEAVASVSSLASRIQVEDNDERGKFKNDSRVRLTEDGELEEVWDEEETFANKR